MSLVYVNGKCKLIPSLCLTCLLHCVCVRAIQHNSHFVCASLSVALGLSKLLGIKLRTVEIREVSTATRPRIFCLIVCCIKQTELRLCVLVCGGVTLRLVTLSEENGLRVLENTVQKKTRGPKGNEITVGRKKKRYIEERHDLHSSQTLLYS